MIYHNPAKMFLFSSKCFTDAFLCCKNACNRRILVSNHYFITVPTRHYALLLDFVRARAPACPCVATLLTWWQARS